MHSCLDICQACLQTAKLLAPLGQLVQRRALAAQAKAPPAGLDLQGRLRAGTVGSALSAAFAISGLRWLAALAGLHTGMGWGIQWQGVTTPCIRGVQLKGAPLTGVCGRGHKQAGFSGRSSCPMSPSTEPALHLPPPASSCASRQPSRAQLPAAAGTAQRSSTEAGPAATCQPAPGAPAEPLLE